MIHRKTEVFLPNSVLIYITMTLTFWEGLWTSLSTAQSSIGCYIPVTNRDFKIAIIKSEVFDQQKMTSYLNLGEWDRWGQNKECKSAESLKHHKAKEMGKWWKKSAKSEVSERNKRCGATNKGWRLLAKTKKFFNKCISNKRSVRDCSNQGEVSHGRPR